MVRTCRCFFLVHWWCSRPWHMGQASYAQKRNLEISHGWTFSEQLSLGDSSHIDNRCFFCKHQGIQIGYLNGNLENRKTLQKGTENSYAWKWWQHTLYRIQGKGVISFSFIWFPNKNLRLKTNKTVRESKTPAATGPTWPKLAIRLQLCGSGIDLFWL